MCLIFKKKAELNIYISGMSDLEYKLLFSLMAGCGYKLLLSTGYMIQHIWHDRILQHNLEVFYEHLYETILFYFIVTFSWWTNPLEWHKLKAGYLAWQILNIITFYILHILHIWHWQILNKSFSFLLNTCYWISGITDCEHKLAFFPRQIYNFLKNVHKSWKMFLFKTNYT